MLTIFIKVELSPSKRNSFIPLNENPFKIMKNVFYFILRVLSGKTHPQIKLQPLQKVLICIFGQLVLIFRKIEVVGSKRPFFVMGSFRNTHSMCLNIGF